MIREFPILTKLPCFVIIVFPIYESCPLRKRFLKGQILICADSRSELFLCNRFDVVELGLARYLFIPTLLIGENQILARAGIKCIFGKKT